MKLPSLAFSIVLGCIGGGCIPAEFTTVPGLSGKIVDADAARPVVGARVFVNGESFGSTSVQRVVEAPPIAKTVAGDEGNVDLKPETRWALLFVGMDFIQEPLRVTVVADGFQTMSLEESFTETPSSNRYIQLGTVRLQRIAASRPAAKGPLALGPPDQLTSRVNSKDDIYDSIKTFFGKGH
jgi:hypothetical protein